jgi:hypothetical protein
MKCPLHPTEELIEREGKYGKFSSHKNGSEWCNGKEPKKDPVEMVNVKLDKLLGDVFKLNSRFDDLAKYLDKQFSSTRGKMDEPF